MADQVTGTAPMGTVHELDHHRTSEAPPLSLVKDPTNGQDKPGVGTHVRRGGRAVRKAVTHERTRTSARAAVRHTMYVVGGARIVTRRAWEGRSAARYERMIRAAEAIGDQDAAREWEERGQRFRAARHRRRMELLEMPLKAAKGAVVGTAATAGGLLGLGIVMAIADGDFHEVIAPTMGVIDAIRWAVFIATVVWGPAKMIAPWMGLAILHTIGRQQNAAPTWALPAGQRPGEGEPITPSVVVTALRDLGIPALRKAIKDMGDAGAQMLSPITIAGCGVEVEVSLPSGVSTEEVLNRRRKLAENLNRHEHELHPSIPPRPRTVRLWIADSGALDEPIGPSPLVTDPDTTADLYTGRAPWGQDLRGDAAMISLLQRMLLITGLSNQGKTAALRTLALWLAFDPTVEFRIADLKGVGDWNMFDGIATVLIQGPTDEQVMRATHMVEAAGQEMEARLDAVRESGSTSGVTREMACTEAFHPIVLIVDEAQKAYGSGAVGKDRRPYGGQKATSRYLQAVKKIHDQGRAVNVTIWEGTQDPTNENLPKRSREGNHIRASLVLGTEEQSKMALGDQAVMGGAAPHKLRQGLDKGTLVVAGDGITLAPGQSSITVRTHYVDGDQATEIAERAKARRGVTLFTADDAAAPEQVDHLANIAAALGDQARMRTDEVRQRLAEHNPAAYRTFTASDLTRTLEAVDAAPYKSGGVMVVGRTRVLEALATRDEDPTDDDFE